MERARTFKNNINVGNIGLFLIGIFSLSYLVFSRRFAELNIQFPFLDFPVFIGEVLLFVCLTLLFVIIKGIANHPGRTIKVRPFKELLKVHWKSLLLIIYFLFVLIKALWGYYHWGPLAFRHAALFYYPLFAIFSYSFYKRGSLNVKTRLLLACVLFIVLLFVLGFKFFYSNAVMTYFILAIILIRACPRVAVKYLFVFLLLIFTPYKLFFNISRTFLVSNLAVGMYIAIILFFLLKMRRLYKVILSVLLAALMILGVIKFPNKNNVESIMNFKKLIKEYRIRNEWIMRERDSFQMEELEQVKLYNPEAKRVITPEENKTGEIAMTANSKVKRKITPEEMKTGEIVIAAAPVIEITKSGTRQNGVLIDSGFSKKGRSLDVALSNSLFRITIWWDALTQLNRKKPPLGFDFGAPFRSISVEIVDQARGEWSRDGWISLHNSHLHFLYRAGLLGIFIIAAIFIILFKMISKSIRLRSVNGVLLCGILLNWLIAAFFLPILELPYNAIPFWSIFGITLAYLNNLKKNEAYEGSQKRFIR